MTIHNYTPHPVHIVGEDGQVAVTMPSTGIIRLKATTVADEPIDGIPTSRTVFGEPEGLPSYEQNTYYIVSQLVKSALPQRTDLLVPAEVVRDAEGNIIGCKSLGR
jgi:hypothetical protein